MSDGGASRAWRAPARPRRLLLVAGEASGDLHGADLVRALRASVPALEVFGVGGERLREAGMETVADVGQVATMGLEATGRLRALWHAYRTLARRLRADPPDLCVLIDFPEFNLRLARVANRAGVPVLYYIGPQVWAWRRGRVRKIARRVDRLAVVFPFEPALYAPRPSRRRTSRRSSIMAACRAGSSSSARAAAAMRGPVAWRCSSSGTTSRPATMFGMPM